MFGAKMLGENLLFSYQYQSYHLLFSLSYFCFYIVVFLRFFPLLAKPKADHPECDVLLNVFALLSAKNTSTVTIATVMDIAESLASTEDFVASETETELSVSGSVFPLPVEGTLTTGLQT